MFKTIFSIFAFTVIAAQAQAGTWSVGPVNGLIETQGDLQLTSARAEMYCKFCQSTMAGCAGGPIRVQALNTTLKTVSPTSYQVSVQPGQVKTSYGFKKLQRCGYALVVKGVDSKSGQSYDGDIVLVSSEKYSANPVWLDENAAEGLSEILTATPLKLEIKAWGLSDPAIHETEDMILPYFGD